MASKLRLIILGAPGSGKGTISSRIVKEFRLAHLSSGDLLRSNIENKTDIGLKVKDLVSKGKFVSDDLITKLIVQELNKIKYSNWLLDGFPRNLNQCKSMDFKQLGVDRVINLNVPFDIIINRLKHRWVHPASGRVYNTEFSPPKVARKDDVTGEPLVQREDDSEKVVLTRLKEYEKQTKPIIEYFSSKNILTTYTGNTSDYIWPFIQKDVKKIEDSNLEERLVKYNKEEVTHTGQKYALSDYKRIRFQEVTGKQTNKNFAIDLIAKEPVVVAEGRVVCSSSGGALGHPKIYINIDSNDVHVCNYSGVRFIRKKFYNETIHGKSISYDEYLNKTRQAASQ